MKRYATKEEVEKATLLVLKQYAEAIKNLAKR
jgi:hypothetical protein